ncbi:uncharacterized protein LOC125822435 isoform X2 [Solanum verrucosum]|uniref:uncharacterized protein LOC125822435 isoform X2 n=1 Tax=Solanum verrucosum TaxID=315347 RepID=UPI0020CFEC81|nr:uncharacterized protein LOC125822435 isoform X2 [Solanum verrucosum]
MKREEKRQKLHEGLLRMLYPPPPSPPSQEENSDDEPFDILEQGDQIPDQLEKDRGSSSSGDQEETDHGSEKLTRAQRKRIRRKKLKEASSRRQNIIGPLLPTEEIDREDVNVSTPPQGVRQNANETDDADSCLKQNKQKQRRMAKRLVGGSSKSTGDDNKT